MTTTKPTSLIEAIQTLENDDQLLSYLLEREEEEKARNEARSEARNVVKNKNSIIDPHVVKAKQHENNNVADEDCEKEEVEDVPSLYNEILARVEDSDYDLGLTTLILAIKLEKSSAVISKLIELGSQELILMKAEKGCTVLHHACIKSFSKDIISTLIDVGGLTFLLAQDDAGDTALHKCMRAGFDTDIVSLLLDIGGASLIFAQNSEGSSALHCLLMDEYDNTGETQIEIFNKLVHLGGKFLVTMKDLAGKTVLHYTCHGGYPIEMNMDLLDVGGRELVMAMGESNETALFTAFKKHPDFYSIVSRMIDLGGQELILKQDRNGNTLLHLLLGKSNDSNKETLMASLLDIGGAELLMTQNSMGETALYHHYFRTSGAIENDDDDTYAYFTRLIQHGILVQAGGPFGIGGLFIYNQSNMNKQLYHCWERCLYAIHSIMDIATHNNSPPPLLHAAIVNRAPKEIIKDIIERFPFTILQYDELYRLPIEAVGLHDIDLQWNDGFDLVIEATASAQNRSILYVATHYGLGWSDRLKELVESSSMNELCYSRDDWTGLPTFLLAATGDQYDLNVIYEMTKLAVVPHLGTALCNSNDNKSVEDMNDDDDCRDKKRGKLN
jgi:ankyrin repeat protein